MRRNVGDRRSGSSGRTSLLIASLAAATARGDVAALIDTHDTFDAGSARAAALALDHLLWARGDPAGVPRPQVLLERAIKAFGLVLEAGGFGVVALDLGDVAPVDLARLPFTTWRRLQRFVEGRDTVALVLAPVPVARSARGVTLELTASPSTAVWAGESRRARRLTGLTLDAARPDRATARAAHGLSAHACSAPLRPPCRPCPPRPPRPASRRRPTCSPPWPAARRRGSKSSGPASW